MTDAVIEITGLRKTYKRLRNDAVVAVGGLDLSVPRGGVYGFLGPNGSGKTTTIRCLLGLVRPSGGELAVLGRDVRRGLAPVIDDIGALVESPKFFPSFSGRRNLALLASTRGIAPGEVDRALETVGLGSRAKDRYRTYSLGMKQRLGVAGALLKDPQLLILDEPANGLDPAGIKEMRELLRRLAGEGRTVFVSSHQLVEVSQTCDSVAIISAGRCVAAGSVSEIVSQGRSGGVVVTIDDPSGAIAVLSRAGLNSVPGDAPDEIVVQIDAAGGATVTEVLARDGRFLRGLRPVEVTLEEAFLELTGEPPP